MVFPDLRGGGACKLAFTKTYLFQTNIGGRDHGHGQAKVIKGPRKTDILVLFGARAVILEYPAAVFLKRYAARSR